MNKIQWSQELGKILVLSECSMILFVKSTCQENVREKLISRKKIHYAKFAETQRKN